MNKTLLILFISLLLFNVQPNVIKSNQNELDNKLLSDTLITVLNPYISEEVAKHYGYYKLYGLYDVEIINLTRESEGGFSFKVTVQVKTFEHAHNSPFGEETITFEINPSSVKTINFIHKGDKEDKKVNYFYKEVLSDIQTTFNLNLKSFSKYNYKQLQHMTEKQKEYQSLLDIVKNIKVNILNPNIEPPYKNVIDPVTFVKGNKALIIFKISDGTNIIYEVIRKK
ncbi:DUF3888 domain-containing protein [Cytobacillus sp. IB215316]|uniref:DUF3888 domain-containing protein n=1 Tax=Cytobacillus sp. IB215316 TaxID=3097354 RepID=UPI002A16AD05|nr:DUF3888 domain-containing protein [Cytobacillus sp. IB215316]MDX8363482.1 DUF3888 domain-containing protein [Cytobacillus sp. IB215316]